MNGLSELHNPMTSNNNRARRAWGVICESGCTEQVSRRSEVPLLVAIGFRRADAPLVGSTAIPMRSHSDSSSLEATFPPVPPGG